MSNKQEDLRKKIVYNYLQSPHLSYAEIGRLAGASRATARNAIVKFKNEQTTVKKKGSGRKEGFKDFKTVQKVIALFKRNPRVSVRDVARKYNISTGLVCKIKAKHGLTSYRMQKVPNRNDQVDKRAKLRARKLYTQVLSKHRGCVLMDDETMVKGDFQQLPGNEYYVARVRGGVNKIFKYKKLDKFAKKYMVWQAICTCGRRTRPYIVSKGTMNAKVYKSCLIKYLKPLYDDHNTPPVFWPDLATCHYEKNVVKWYNDNQIHFVTKQQNPPNTPELRPVEQFWAQMKFYLKKHSKPAKNLTDFKLKWKKAAKSIGESGVQNLMKGVKRKLRNFYMTQDKN